MIIFAQLAQAGSPEQAQLAYESRAVILVTTYLLILSFILICVAAVFFIFNLRRCGCAILCLYGADIFLLPLHVTGLAGLFIFGVGIIGLIKISFESKPTQAGGASGTGVPPS